MAEFDADEYRKGEWRTAVDKEHTHYQRLGLSAAGHVSAAEVVLAHRARANWWRQRGAQVQGGKNNPLIAELAPFIKTAEENLQLALTVLSDVDRKSAYDRQIADHGAKANEGKLLDFIRFTLRHKILTPTEKNDLLAQAHELGISQERAEELIRQEMIKTGSSEGEDPSAAVLGRNSGPIPVVPGAASPRLSLNLTALSLGRLRKGEECTRTFIIDNLGGGVLQGTIDVSHAEWIKVSQAEIDPRRHHQEVTVRVDTSSLALGTSHVGMVEIRSNGGRQGIRIDFSIELEASAVSRSRTRLFWSGIVIGAVFGLSLYEMAPSTLTRDAIAHVAFLVGFVSFVVVGAKAGKWGGGIGTFVAAMFAQPIQYASMSAYSAAAWAMVVSSFLYFFARRLLVASLAGDGRPRIWAAMSGVGLGTTIILAGVGITATVKTQLNPHAANLPVEDKLAGSSIGQPAGIRWVRALDDRGAVFSAANSSRIEYPGLIPLEGTLEFWIKVNSGYHYANSQFNANQDVAMIFSSDAQGGDVTWPGTTILTVSRSGTLSYRMATKMGDTSTMPIEARGTKFRFAEWHALGVSYGGQGEYIMLDGRIVASAPKRTQTFGQAGNHQEPLDIPTIGETVSHFWAHHRYEGGFEGILAAFRVSAKQTDWILAQGIKRDNRSAAAALGESETQAVDCRKLSLRLYNVDDSLQASLTNAAVTSQVVLSASERQDTGFVDISSRTQPGPNSLLFQLTNYRGGYTYAYQLRSNSTIIDEASCGNVGIAGCNNNDQKLGVVVTHTFNFQCSDTSTANRPNDSDIAALSPKESIRAEALSDLVYMPSHQGLGLIELNVAENKIRRTAKTSLFNNTFVSWNANRREFYVAANNGDAVSVIAADTFVETAAMKGDVGWNTYSTALSRDGRDLYLACSGAPTVRLVSFDTASRRHIATTAVSRGGTGAYLAISPNGGRLYVSSGSDLYEYQASGLRLLRQQTFGGWQTAPLAVSSDGQFLFALQRGGVVRVQANSLTTDKSIALPEAGSRLSLSTDGRYALAAGQDALYRVPLSMDAYTLIRPPRRTNWRFFEFAESSDGRALYVLSGGNGQESLWVIDLATRQVIKTVDGIPYPGSIISVPGRYALDRREAASGLKAPPKVQDEDPPPPSHAPQMAPPTVAAFEAVPSPVEQCAVAILRWTVKGASSASIDPEVGNVDPSSGYKVVRPIQTTRYTLRADGLGGSVSRDVTLSVVHATRASCGQ